MWATFTLEPPGAGLPGPFAWNPATGEVAGAKAASIQAAAEEARAEGMVSDTPSGLYTESDPLTTWEGMAVLIASLGFRVPPALADHLPEVDQPETEDPTIRPVY